MAWYAYCISEKQAFPELARHRKPIPLESVLGVSGNQVFLYPASDLAVVVSEHNPAEGLNQKSGVDHARVIADCFQHSTVLPFRFGTVFDDDESLRKSIRSNQRQFLANIDKLRGKTEMHLKIFVDDCCGRENEQTPTGRRRRPGVSLQPARKRHPPTRASDACAGSQLPDASDVYAARRGSQLPADRERQDGARHRPPDRPQVCGALPKQVRHHQRHDARVPDAAVWTVAAVSLCSSVDSRGACRSPSQVAAVPQRHGPDRQAQFRFSSRFPCWV